MNTRFNSLVFDSRLRLTADISKIEKYNFDKFCLSLLKTNFNNIFTLILLGNTLILWEAVEVMPKESFTVKITLKSAGVVIL